ncbi:MAG: hypothetical protein IKS84_00960, partial [Lachnospiraceae bacterium]|nr:hypothetical protein [Lachnospiraceae bacterium]
KGYYYTGNPIKPQIHIYDGAKLLALDTDYVLSYKNNVRASTGVTKDSQRPQIIIKMLGKRTGSKVVYFNILPTPIDKLVAEDSTLCATYTKKGNQLKPALVCEGTNVKYSDKDITFKYFEANSIGAATGIESTCVDPGLYAVKAYAGQSGNFTSGASGRQVATIKVYGKVSMSSVKINGFKTKLLYNNGAPITQSAVSLAYKSDVLQEGVDYTVTYENNYNIGTATVTYEAVKDSAGNYTGDFAGKVSKVFSISGRYILKTGAGGNATITLARDYYEFTNAAIKPVVKVTVNAVNDKGEPEVRTLVEGKDYVVACKNNKAVADANAIKAPQVIIKGKGYYQFEDKAVTKNFTITKPDLSSLVLTISDKPYSNNPNAYKSTKITFTDRNYNDLKLKAGKDYTIISYITSDGSDTPASGETVYVSIAAKEGGSYTGNKTGEYRITGPMYTDISKAKAVINPGAKGKATACAYTGDEIKPGQTGQPGLVLTAGSKKLRLGTDYEIVGYYNNIAPGKRATVLIRGIGNCRGIRAINFVITTKPVSQHWGGVYGQ